MAVERALNGNHRRPDVIKAIIFDKDGTILDLGNTWEKPSIDVVRQLLSLSSLSPEESEAFERSIGIEGETLLANTLFSAGSISEQAAKLVEVVPLSIREIEVYLENYYYDHIADSEVELQVIGNIESILQQLKSEYFLGLVTNDNRRLTEVTMSKIGLIDYFDWMASSDEFKPKPDPIALHALAERHGLKFDEMIYIGDSSVDMEYGKHTFASIGFALEPSHREFLKEADYIIESFEELPPLIDKLNQLKRAQEA